MYLSSLLIDMGDNPDRPRPGKLWLRNLYHVHQRLCMAFPSATQKRDDEYFLKPFKPEEFARHQVHVERQPNTGFLFRIDFPVEPFKRWEKPRPGGRAVILVQSAVEPDWDYAFHNARHLLAAPPQVKFFGPHFTKDQRLRFRLVANPTKKIGTIKKEERLNYSEEELKEKKGRHGRRVPVPSATEIEDWRLNNPNADARIFIDAKLFDWLAHRGENAGFSLEQNSTLIQTSYIYFNKTKKREAKPEDKQQDEQSRLRSVCYDGILRVTDPEAFGNTVINGIGPGKAFGFGLLSLALCQNPLPGEEP